MGDFAETLDIARNHEIALGVTRTLRAPIHFNAWATVTELYQHLYALRHRPISALDLYQALHIINRDKTHVEYGIGSRNLYCRAPMPTHNRHEENQNARKH